MASTPLSHCPGGSPNFHRGCPGDQNISRGKPRSRHESPGAAPEPQKYLRGNPRHSGAAPEPKNFTGAAHWGWSNFTGAAPGYQNFPWGMTREEKKITGDGDSGQISLGQPRGCPGFHRVRPGLPGISPGLTRPIRGSPGSPKFLRGCPGQTGAAPDLPRPGQ